MKATKNDLLNKAKELLAQGYKKLHATDDGQFFTDAELAAGHAKTIASEIYKFASEDFVKVSEDAPEEPVMDLEPGTEPEPVKDPEPVTEPEPVKDSAPAPKPKPVENCKPVNEKKLTQSKKK